MLCNKPQQISVALTALTYSLLMLTWQSSVIFRETCLVLSTDHMWVQVSCLCCCLPGTHGLHSTYAQEANSNTFFSVLAYIRSPNILITKTNHLTKAKIRVWLAYITYHEDRMYIYYYYKGFKNQDFNWFYYTKLIGSLSDKVWHIQKIGNYEAIIKNI